MEPKIRVTVWDEFRYKEKHNAMAVYPRGLHSAVGGFLSENGDMDVTLATLDDPDQGIPDSLLEKTDVLIWWGHTAHKEVDDRLVNKIQTRVFTGKTGFIALHSAHRSKPFMAIVGTNGNLQWGREQKEIIWNMMPSHPIAAGIPEHFILSSEEMYSEPFYIPQPDALVFGGWFEDGNIFRSGACFVRGAGKVFYFQPGHETCGSFYNPYVKRIITNAVRWAKPNDTACTITDKCPHITNPVINEFNT